MSNWNPQCEESIIQSFTNLFRAEESRRPDLLPHLAGAEELLLVSDYSGEGKGYPFQVLSYLLVDVADAVGKWNEQREAVRSRYIPDGRRLDFKSLSDQSRQKAFLPFLHAADTLNGIIISICIDKQIDPFAGWIPIGNPADAGATPHNSKAFEKLLRVAYFGAVLISGFSTAQQEVHWVMDDDDIIANESLKKSTAVACRKLIHIFSHDRTAKIYFAAASELNEDSLAEDLIALVDMSGGANADTAAALDRESMPRSSELFLPILKRLSTKTTLINAWLSDRTSRLKKIRVTVRQHSEGALLISMGQNSMRPNEPAIGSPIWTPLDRGWKNSARFWDLPNS